MEQKMGKGIETRKINNEQRQVDRRRCMGEKEKKYLKKERKTE